MLKIVLISLITAFCQVTSYCAVFVYEVTIDSGVFITASQKDPSTYIYFNGGRDIIKALKVLKTFDDKSLNNAIKEFGLGDKNEKRISKSPSDSRSTINTPYIWWR